MPRVIGVSLVQGGRGRLQAFAPLLLWCCLAVALVGWDVYRRLAAGTTLTFRILVEGQEPSIPPEAKLDGVSFTSGDRARFGTRVLAIDSPGLEPHQRTLKVRFGLHDLGGIKLTRSRGSIEVVAHPVPREIRITGDGFTATATNNRTSFDSLIIGTYTVSADFGFLREERSVEVKRGDRQQVEFSPAVGSLFLTTDPTNAVFRLTGTDRPDVQLEGDAPHRVDCLPAGEYRLVVSRGEYAKESTVNIKRGQTNQVRIEFQYAQVSFDTTPGGAKVSGQDGELGTTPLALREVIPGRHEFRIEKEGFLPVSFLVEARTNSVQGIRTNLVSVRYATAMEQARFQLSFEPSNAQAALAHLDEALTATPGDAVALALKSKVQAAMKAEEARLAEQKRQEDAAAAAEKREVEAKVTQSNPSADPKPVPLPKVSETEAPGNPAEVFRKASEAEQHADLFDEQVWSASGDVAMAADALRRMVEREGSGWKLDSETKSGEQVFVFRCTAVAKFLSTTRRHALVVIGQSTQGEVQIRAKFWDYMATKVGLSLTQGLSKEGLVPVHQRFFKADQAPAIEARRKSVPEEFKTKLFKEMK